VWIRIRILLYIFIIDLQDANKSFSAYYFLKVLLHHFSKIKSQKEVTKHVKIKVFLTILALIEGSGSESGSIPLTNGSGGSGFGPGSATPVPGYAFSSVKEQIYGPLIFEFLCVAAGLKQCLSASGSFDLNGCWSLVVNLY
jgi:hypothetical protein